MNWDSIWILFIFNVVKADHDLNVNRIINIMNQDRRLNDDTIVDTPEDANNLPEAEAVMPGHTLIQPKTDMLQSSVKYPQDNLGNVVYGNMDQLSITYGKTPQRILYTGFRKANSLLDSTIHQAIENIKLSNGYNQDTDVIIIESKALYEKSNPKPQKYGSKADLVHVSREENSGGEILDASSSDESEEIMRRSRRKKKWKGLSGSSMSSSVSTSSSESSDYDKNPGNPYTLNKGKYLQNYPWNHFMDGDHMNISPFGPAFKVPQPSGVDLFFGRKWWYFNQDDYKPLR